MANEVNILVKSTDKTKEGFDSASNNAKGFSNSLKAISTAFAGLAAIDFFKGTMDEARESIRANKLTEAAIKSTGGAAKITADQVGDLATSISNATAVDDELIQSGANLLLTFTNIQNGVGKGNDIFNQATKVATDMTAALNNGAVTQEGLKASSIQLGKALNDPIKGISALQRVGVTFTADQKKQIENFIKHNDIMSAQKVILGELNKEFGGAAAAAADPAQKAQVAWKNFQEEIGLKLLPVVTKLLDWFQKILPYVIKIADWIINFAQNNKVLVGFLLAVIAAIKIWTVVQAILDAELFANPIGLIVLAIAALVAGIIYVATKTRFFQTVWADVWGFMKAIGAWFAGPFVDFFVGAWDWIVNAFKTARDAIIGFLQKIINFAIDVILTVARIGAKIPGPFQQAFKDAVDAATKAKEDINYQLNQIKDKTVTVTVNGVVRTASDPSHYFGGLASGGIVGAASGMIRNGLTWVGEQGPELVRLPSGSSVYSHGDSQRMASQSGDSGGQIQVTPVVNPAADSLTATWLQKMMNSGLLTFNAKWIVN